MKVEVFVFFALICVFATRATTVHRLLDDSDGSAIKVPRATGSSIENRKHKPYKDLFLLERKSGYSTVYVNPLRGIALMGGLQSLVTFVVIKIKVILVIVTIVGAVALALKVFGLLKYSNYFYKNDYPSVLQSPQDFPGYPGPQYSLSPHDNDNHHFKDWSSYSDHYARSLSEFPKSMNITEIVYSFMNVNKDDCRARLICEFEINVSRSPLFQYLTRHAIAGESKKKFDNCTEYYKKCVGASEKRSIRWKRRRALREEDTTVRRVRKKIL